MTGQILLCAALLFAVEAGWPAWSFSQVAKPGWQAEWERAVELAKKERSEERR